MFCAEREAVDCEREEAVVVRAGVVAMKAPAQRLPEWRRELVVRGPLVEPVLKVLVFGVLRLGAVALGESVVALGEGLPRITVLS